MNTPSRSIDLLFAGLLLAAAAVGICGARPYAGSHNDGSRLATIQTLVEYHTFAIEDSLYVPPASATAPPERRPYLVIEHAGDYLNMEGTLDKVLVNGHYYSHQPPLPSVLFAGPYWIAHEFFGLSAGEKTALYTWLMTVLASGLPYLIAVAAVARTGRLLGLEPRLYVALAASFAFATVAPAYTRHVNAHILQLAVAAVVFMLLAAGTRGGQSGVMPVFRVLLLGLLNGFGYAIEQPTGGLLLAGTGLVLLYRRPRFTTAFLYGLAALPSVVAHHAIVYSLAGIWRPLGQVAEFFDYPGSGFSKGNLTGFWNHESLFGFLQYAGCLVFLNERGFLVSNVPLYLLVPGGGLLLRRVRVERPEMWLAGLWCAGVWLVYSALSVNFSGWCCSVRWFVPLLAAGYFLIALVLRERPALAPDFLLLSAWGAVLAAEMWFYGTWTYRFYSLWPVQVLALLSWTALHLQRRRARRALQAPAQLLVSR